MTSEPLSTETPSDRITFAPLKPKRRFKVDQQPTEPAQPHEPVLINARVELNRQRARLARSGRLRVQWRRVTPPSELLEVIPKRSHSPLLAQVVDKVKSHRPQSGQQQGIWSLLRDWALAFR